MAIYVVTGKLGTGKSKLCVQRARVAINQKRRVASNIDLNLEVLVPKDRKARYARLPDKPTVEDLHAIGHGNPESYDEERNGVLILDELGSWLNARAFMDPQRAPVIDWLIHARKHGWDVYFIAQSLQQVDKQVRESLAELVITCYRMDKFKIPVVGWLIDAVSSKLSHLPRFHVAITKMNLGTNNWTIVDREVYRNDDLHKAYDTRQVFVADPSARAFSRLSANYFAKDWKRPVGTWQRLKRFFTAAPARAASPFTPKPKSPLMQFLSQYPPDVRMAEFKRLRRLRLI